MKYYKIAHVLGGIFTIFIFYFLILFFSFLLSLILAKF